MGSENHYDYYKTSKETKVELIAEYEEKIESKRESILEDLKKDTGCIAWTETSSWGGQSMISELVYPIGHQILDEPYIKIRSKREYEGVDVACVSGMGNRKLGKQFDAVISKYNKKLESVPDYQDWLAKRLGIMRTGLGGAHSSGRGIAMLSTKIGNAGDIIVAMIPNNKEEKHGGITIPDCLEKITYGQFFDLTNKS